MRVRAVRSIRSPTEIPIKTSLRIKITLRSSRRFSLPIRARTAWKIGAHRGAGRRAEFDRALPADRNMAAINPYLRSAEASTRADDFIDAETAVRTVRSRQRCSRSAEVWASRSRRSTIYAPVGFNGQPEFRRRHRHRRREACSGASGSILSRTAETFKAPRLPAGQRRDARTPCYRIHGGISSVSFQSCSMRPTVKGYDIFRSYTKSSSTG
jgi:hypothetical protein